MSYLTTEETEYLDALRKERAVRGGHVTAVGANAPVAAICTLPRTLPWILEVRRDLYPDG